MASNQFLRRELPLLLVIITAVPILATRFIDDPILKGYQQEIGVWSSFISMIAWGLGVFYLFQGEYHNMRMKNDLNQKILFGVLCVFSVWLVILAFYFADFSKPTLGLTNPGYTWWYLGFYRAQSTAFYGLMFLYLMSASYRMLRFRSLESSILLVSGLLYLFRNASIFTLYIPQLVPIGEWLINYPGNAATTAAVMAMAFGSVLIGIRQLLGRERTAVEVAS